MTLTLSFMVHATRAATSDGCQKGVRRLTPPEAVIHSNREPARACISRHTPQPDSNSNPAEKDNLRSGRAAHNQHGSTVHDELPVAVQIIRHGNVLKENLHQQRRNPHMARLIVGCETP